MLERAHMIDVIHSARFAISEHDNSKPKMLSLAKVIDHALFSNLPLKKTKGLLVEGEDKGVQIYEMWKNDKDKFKRYAEGDSHDTLLIFEEIFKHQITEPVVQVHGRQD